MADFFSWLQYRQLVVISVLLLLCHGFAKSTEALDGVFVELEGGVQVVYQIPSNGKGLAGVLFVAHGCSHSATDWWPKSESCSSCTGLPVEQAIVRKALEHNFAVLAVTSSNRQHKCWVHKVDRAPVMKSIRYVYEKANIPLRTETIPLYLLGASSGGAFVGTLAQDAKAIGLTISAVCVQIMFVKIHRVDQKMVPTLFIHMPLESHTKKMITTVIDEMNKITPNTASELLCKKKELVPSYFFDHSAALNSKDSATLVAALDTAGFLTQSKILRENPRESAWREVATTALQHIIPEKDSLVADQSAISELLNLAYASHEITDDYLTETFDFFKKHVTLQAPPVTR